MTTKQVEQIKQAKKNNAILIGSNREIRRLPLYLHENEIVHGLITGSPDRKRGRGIVVATNERILFIKDGWFFRDNQDFSYDTISSVEFKSRIFFGTFIMYGKGDETAYTNIGRFGGAKFTKIIREIISNGLQSNNNNNNNNNNNVHQTTPIIQNGLKPLPPLPPFPQKVSSHSKDNDKTIQELTDLSELRDHGVISLNDFEAKKQELLKRL